MSPYRYPLRPIDLSFRLKNTSRHDRQWTPISSDDGAQVLTLNHRGPASLADLVRSGSEATPEHGNAGKRDTVPNERLTETIVREHLAKYAVEGQRVEEQQSTNPSVKRALSAASKHGSGAGRPEFIVTFPTENPKLVIVFECKADTKSHASATRDRPRDFAVDGVLHYAMALARSFDVIAVAVSGEDSGNLLVSTFRQLRGASSAEVLESATGPVNHLVTMQTYQKLLAYDPAIRMRTEAELLAFSRSLHNYMRDYGKLSEAEKPLVVSGILLALKDETFQRTWREYKPKYLAKQLYDTIEQVAKESDIKEDKLETMLAPYAFVKTHPEISRPNENGETPLVRLISDIEEHIKPFIDTYHDVDVIGQFYGEFLRYTGGDKKGLGIVLTPRHLTELFVKIADISPNDTIVDTCAGTGGFLISAMMELDHKLGADDVARDRIREHHLIGVEQLPHMFALAASNMILRGDGKANLYRGSCFDDDVKFKLKNGVAERHDRPTVGLINPPFSQKGKGQHELEFVETLLDVLAPGGTVVAVLPMSCAIEPHPVRTRLLRNHTLVAQMSLPNDLFSPVGTITCAMVFRAHHPHDSQKPTWFGYWKNDGFVKTKDRGRIDLNNDWGDIRDGWLADFHARREIPGRSVLHSVEADDEWCVEAYLQTDYSALGARDLEDTLRKYAIFSLMYGQESTPLEVDNDAR